MLVKRINIYLKLASFLYFNLGSNIIVLTYSKGICILFLQQTDDKKRTSLQKELKVHYFILLLETEAVCVLFTKKCD